MLVLRKKPKTKFLRKTCADLNIGKMEISSMCAHNYGRHNSVSKTAICLEAADRL